MDNYRHLYSEHKLNIYTWQCLRPSVNYLCLGGCSAEYEYTALVKFKLAMLNIFEMEYFYKVIIIKYKNEQRIIK